MHPKALLHALGFSTAPDTLANHALWSCGDAQSAVWPVHMLEVSSDVVPSRVERPRIPHDDREAKTRARTAKERLEMHPLHARHRGLGVAQYEARGVDDGASVD